MGLAEHAERDPDGVHDMVHRRAGRPRRDREARPGHHPDSQLPTERRSRVRPPSRGRPLRRRVGRASPSGGVRDRLRRMVRHAPLVDEEVVLGTVDEPSTDEWGVPHHRAEFETGYGGAHFEIRTYPLAEATVKDLDDYPWPDPRDPSFLGDLPELIPRVRKETPYAILSQFGRGGIYEQAKYLRGFEQLFIDMAIDEEFVHALFAKLLDVELQMNRIGIQAVGKYLD